MQTHRICTFISAFLTIRKLNFIPFRKSVALLLCLQSTVCRSLSRSVSLQFLLASTCYISLTAFYCLVCLPVLKDLYRRSPVASPPFSCSIQVNLPWEKRKSTARREQLSCDNTSVVLESAWRAVEDNLSLGRKGC